MFSRSTKGVPKQEPLRPANRFASQGRLIERARSGALVMPAVFSKSQTDVIQKRSFHNQNAIRMYNLDRRISGAPGQYRSLRAADEIRLLRLEPFTSKSRELHCELEYATLSENPSYEAISYAWGDPSFSRTLLCGNNVLRITENLHSALSQLCR